MFLSPYELVAASHLTCHSVLWSAITVLSSRTYLNLVKVARNRAQNQPAIASQASHLSFRGGPFPRVIGRPLPVRTQPNTLHPVDSEIFYTGYFQDEFAFDPVTLDAMSVDRTPLEEAPRDYVIRV